MVLHPMVLWMNIKTTRWWCTRWCCIWKWNPPDGGAPDGVAYENVYHLIGDASDGAAYIAHIHVHYVILSFKCHTVSCPGGVLLIVLPHCYWQISVLLYFCASLSVFDDSMLKSMTDYEWDCFRFCQCLIIIRAYFRLGFSQCLVFRFSQKMDISEIQYGYAV